MVTAKPDIADRADLGTLLRRFYEAALADRLIGPYFTEIAGLDLEDHLPRITDFWERALLRTAEYGGNAFAPHAALHDSRPMTAEHFGRWVQLWRASVDGLYAGPNADHAKAQGERIALSMLRRLAGADASTDGSGGPGFVPLAAVRLRTEA
ncbi:group III truncated hemoglobin [Streptomyces sp. RKAG337]|uniref:group III truncated hemoglobin n=1 Tax=Streptomyces sp. RKAG337 TaxID=2893404 RepID=UPI0020342C28|nr:group III truncated hemoglobin [Streptomyces sp. RKAG337]MCM2427952.1 group III truncated hemoglobin [Streptomyces sp. RKAG337]